MTIRTMPLAGVKPTRKSKQFDREEAEERAFRMLSEGELFYVETDVHEDPLIPTRHDHGHLGGVSLETITAARYPGQAAAKRGPSSIESRDTAPTSRSSSQDTQENEHNAWQQQPAQGIGARVMASNPDPFYSSNRISLKEAQDWDFTKKIEDMAAMESRTRERSFSEPQLSSMRPGATHEKHQIQRQEWQRLHYNQQQEQQNMGTVNEGRTSAAWKMPTSMPSPPQRHQNRQQQQQQQQQQQRQQQQAPRRRRSSDPCADACAGVTEGLQRVWGCLFGPGTEDQNHGVGTLRPKKNSRVSISSRHFASCTSTKTFEVSPTESDREALARLGVVPETGYRGMGAPASMTFTTHIAGYRVVSTILGMHAEYEVCVKGGGRRWSKWQRFSKFKMISECTQGDADTAAAWSRVLRAKPHYRCLNPDYLAQKCNLLEVFLQQVLFAMPTPALLIHFVSQKK